MAKEYEVVAVKHGFAVRQGMFYAGDDGYWGRSPNGTPFDDYVAADRFIERAEREDGWRKRS